MYLQLTGTNVRLLGSMHLFPATSRRTPPWIAEAYDWADALVFESDPATILPFLRADAQSGSLRSAAQLQPLLRDDVWTQLQSLWPASSALAPLDALRPWAALIVAPTLLQHAVEGVEPRLMRSASAQGKPLRFLETGRDVAAALESISLEVIAAALELLMADLGEPQRTLERMHAAWLDGDLPALQRIAVESPMFNLPGLRHALLDIRNRAWAARLRASLDTDERTLVVVGALHLCGPGNLLDCLARPVEAVFDA
ncbi:TraB/GumN family protein [Paraburkholderia sp. MMS20-SJTR3]|uniref:TraB/GumN family protein n=1 Tax=Paraburkholderia sejongensis TaxID=2886946 RepID=A0ABS8JYH2_9BURK|nr:TraB/GumN family protein [Paraburkholderia sp. MMS20-SJTR3]MCC8394956.1 TraB/GumN family protein [Paraburkholderia sp. MMS20-SJTR3]